VLLPKDSLLLTLRSFFPETIGGGGVPEFDDLAAFSNAFGSGDFPRGADLLRTL